MALTSSKRAIGGVALLVVAGIFYGLTSRNTTTSVIFALLLFVGFGLIARGWQSG